jgi:hypothetical protein
MVEQVLECVSLKERLLPVEDLQVRLYSDAEECFVLKLNFQWCCQTVVLINEVCQEENKCFPGAVCRLVGV